MLLFFQDNPLLFLAFSMLLLFQDNPFLLVLLMLLHLSRWSYSSFSLLKLLFFQDNPLPLLALLMLLHLSKWSYSFSTLLMLFLFQNWSTSSSNPPHVAPSLKMILFFFLASWCCSFFKMGHPSFMAFMMLFLFQDWSFSSYGPPYVVGISWWSSSTFGLPIATIRSIPTSPSPLQFSSTSWTSSQHACILIFYILPAI